jgi:hypothetical protein
VRRLAHHIPAPTPPPPRPAYHRLQHAHGATRPRRRHGSRRRCVRRGVTPSARPQAPARSACSSGGPRRPRANCQSPIPSRRPTAPTSWLEACPGASTRSRSRPAASPILPCPQRGRRLLPRPQQRRRGGRCSRSSASPTPTTRAAPPPPTTTTTTAPSIGWPRTSRP